MLLLWYTISIIVCLGDFFFILDSHLAIFGERNCPFGFLLVVFLFLCGAVALSASFFPFGVLYLSCLVLGNCIDSGSLPSFLFTT